MEKLNYHTMNVFQKALYKIGLFFKNLPGNVVKGFKALGRGIVRLGKNIGNGCVNFVKMFIDGDVFTKLSYIVMGFGCLVRGQIVKGLLFLACQVGLLFFIVDFGWPYLKDIGTLGTNVGSEYFDEATGIIRYEIPDNSMLILLYSVMTLMVIAVLLVLYFASINACYKVQKLKEQNRPVPKFKDDIHDLMDKKYHATLLALPTIMAVAFVILPIIFMVLIAFTNYDKSHQPPGNLFTWVGLQNFRDIFGDNPIKTYTFQYLLRWTLVWAIFATVTNYVFGMLLAIMINKKGIKLKKMWRTIFVLTIAVPQFVSLLIMRLIFSDLGPLNVILQNLGMDAVQFLTNGKIARVMVIVINMWVGIPYSMLITSGILMNIPAELYESARIDGASPFKTFTKVTLPYMLFVTTPYLITQFVGNFNNFNVIYLITQGNPASLNLFQAGETDLLVTWLYKLTVNFQDYNLASVIGILVFLVSATLSLIVYNSSGSVKNEEEFQ